MNKKNLILVLFLALSIAWLLSPYTVKVATAETTKDKYYVHKAVTDSYGVIAPWYTGQNGQFDYRIECAARILKDYVWIDRTRDPNVPLAAPLYMYAPRDQGMGQRGARVITAWVDYYRYTGDPVAIAHINIMADVMLKFFQTSPDDAWPRFLISVPYEVDGKVTGELNCIQLDIVAEAGVALLQAYQLTGNKNWFETVKHWGDVFAEKCDYQPGAMPWPRYANPECVQWRNVKDFNKMTGSVTYILAMLDELIKLGYEGKNTSIIKARDAGRAYLQNTLLPKWMVNDTWGRNYWDWENDVQAQTTTDWACRYLLKNKNIFPNWEYDVRNILGLFLNHSSASPDSNSDTFNGAWQFPEGSRCCGRSLAWGPQEFGLIVGWYGMDAESEWAKELARRMIILSTYDVEENGHYHDNIDSNTKAVASAFPIINPSIMVWVLGAMSWQPDILGPNRENRIMRSTEVVKDVIYADGQISYATFDAPENTIDILRLSFIPSRITADAKPVSRRTDLNTNGYTLEKLCNGDCIVSIRHDGLKKICVKGNDPQTEKNDSDLKYVGTWKNDKQQEAIDRQVHLTCEKDAGAEYVFKGNQIRIVAPVGPKGGLAGVFIDDTVVGKVDYWNPYVLDRQIVFHKSGLENSVHTLKFVAMGQKNPLSEGTEVYLDAIQCSDATGNAGYGEGGGPADTQRMIFGYTERMDYIDSKSNQWRPATEFVTRTGLKDTVEPCWWTSKRADKIKGTNDPELYSYGVHFSEFWLNVTVAPGSYYVKIMLAETEYDAAGKRRMTIEINGREKISNLDVFQVAGGPAKAFDLICPEILPQNGIIEVRFIGEKIGDKNCEAMVQSIEIGPSLDAGNLQLSDQYMVRPQ